MATTTFARKTLVKPGAPWGFRAKSGKKYVSGNRSNISFIIYHQINLCNVECYFCLRPMDEGPSNYLSCVLLLDVVLALDTSLIYSVT